MSGIDVFPRVAGAASTLAYAQVTADQALTAGTEADITGLSVTVTVPAGRRLKVTGTIYLQSSNADVVAILALHKNGAQAQSSQYINRTANVAEKASVDFVDTPTAGTHTYKLRGYLGTGATAQTTAGAAYPGFILVEDITGTVWPEGSQVTAGMVASEAWTDYTPNNTNVTVGNGIQTARYMKVGRTVTVLYKLLFGSTTSFAGTILIGLPVAHANTVGIISVGSGFINDAGTTNYLCTAYVESAGASQIKILTHSNANPVGPTQPMTWTTSDVLTFTLVYEAAS